MARWIKRSKFTFSLASTRLLAAAVGGAITVASQSGLFAQAKPSAEDVAFFETSIRPVLVKHCYECHSAESDDIEGGLTLDTRAGIRAGGDTGPAVVPRRVRESLIITALKHTDDDLRMPPDKKLSKSVIADFERWVSLGAPDPRDGAVVKRTEGIDLEAGRKFWAFRPLNESTVPSASDQDWPLTDIDQFLLQAMEEEGLKPVPDASANTLVRRLYFDLIGLPPTPEQVDAFVKRFDADPRSAVEETANQLLESKQYGERWGRHWLDVARFAESSGRATNFAYPHAWRYRDWVIDAFNQDKPYDRFIREQLAGDLLPAANDNQQAENMIATGFLAIGPKTHSERSRQQFRMDLVDEQIDATFQAFQALTVACARCHDHKFDPISQRDYYAVAGIFQNTETCYGTIRIVQSNHPSPLLELPENADAPVGTSQLTSLRRGAIERQIEAQRDRMSDLSGQDSFIARIFMQSRITQLNSQLDMYSADGTPRKLAMGVREAERYQPARMLIRGEIDQPGDRISRGFPEVLTKEKARIRYGTSGREELANFIASKENPLTARVMANRVWLHLIGRGIVATPDNFGSTGMRPSHPELLDYLARSFIDDGWSIKHLIRKIVTSRVYRLSSQLDEQDFESDPDNVFVWRMPERRLEAEALRDTMLHLAGRLDLEPPRGSVVTRGGEGNASFRFRGDPAATDTHRSVYLPILRDQVPEMLSIFDFPDPSLIIGERATTTIPAQALFLMNNSFAIRQADSLARRVTDLDENANARIEQLYKLCYSRPPSSTEVNNAFHFLDQYGKTHSDRATWSALCQAILASAEFAQR